MRLDTHLNLHVKSTAPFFDLERSGRKPNTIRLVDESEQDMCIRAKRIIVHGPGDEQFKRTITGVFDITEVVPLDATIAGDKRVVLLEWGGERT